VAGDTEEEARQIASGRDWRNPRFAVCDALDTPEAHVFGDVVFRSEPVAIKVGKRAAKCLNLPEKGRPPPPPPPACDLPS
jgi:hypothetical protein